MIVVYYTAFYEARVTRFYHDSGGALTVCYSHVDGNLTTERSKCRRSLMLYFYGYPTHIRRD